MEVILGIVGAVTTWLLSTGLFVLLDNLFSLTEKCTGWPWCFLESRSYSL